MYGEMPTVGGSLPAVSRRGCRCVSPVARLAGFVLDAFAGEILTRWAVHRWLIHEVGRG